MKKYLLSFLLGVLLPFQGIVGQDNIKVEGVAGVGLIAGKLSYQDAKKEAINNAKVEALRRAGVSEHLQSYELLFRSEVDRDYSEFFSSEIQAELQGAVQHWELVGEKPLVDPETNQISVEVIINATIRLYSEKPDPMFNVRINGFKGIYEEGESIEFSVYTTIDCYLSIFNITDTETLLMYPNPWEERKMIAGGKDVTFPFGRVDYELVKSSSELEMNRLVFVFTKQAVQFLNYRGEEQFTTQEELFAWIYSLPPDSRRIHYQSFTIR
jgi:hypothetical protein